MNRHLSLRSGNPIMARNTHVRFKGVDDAATYALPEIKTDFFFINFEKVLVDPEALPEFIKLVGIVYDATKQHSWVGLWVRHGDGFSYPG